MRIVAIACIVFSGCTEKKLRFPFTTTTTDFPHSLFPIGFGSPIFNQRSSSGPNYGNSQYFAPLLLPNDDVNEPELEPEYFEEPLPPSHRGLSDISGHFSSFWFDEICRDLEPSHRGDWTTWVGFGGPAMVEYLVDRSRTYSGMKGLFLLAAELAARPVPPPYSPLNITEALGRTCEKFDEFLPTALREPRVSQAGISSHSSLIRTNPAWANLEIAPFANLNLICPPASGASRPEVVAMIANHKIARRLISLGKEFPDAMETSTSYRPRTDTSLAEQLRWLVDTPASTIALGFRITYENDNAVGDGVYRDWIVKMSRKIFESRDLFRLEEDGKYSTLLDSEFDMDTLWKFRGVGRLLALTLIEGIAVGVLFNHAFYSVLLGKHTKWTMEDLYYESQVFHESLTAISHCKGDANCDSFLLAFDTKDGRNLRNPQIPVVSEPVTDDNVDEYVELMLSYEVYGARERIYRQISFGFAEILSPRKTFGNFITSHDLAKIFKGSTDIDIEQLKDSIFYSDFRPNDPVLEWFWRFIEEGGSERAMQLIHFITGMKSLPTGGLSKLPHRIAFEKFPYSQDRMYPKSHLCYAKFDLPNYPNEAELRQRVGEALLQETLGMV